MKRIESVLKTRVIFTRHVSTTASYLSPVERIQRAYRESYVRSYKPGRSNCLCPCRAIQHLGGVRSIFLVHIHRALLSLSRSFLPLARRHRVSRTLTTRLLELARGRRLSGYLVRLRVHIHRRHFFKQTQCTRLRRHRFRSRLLFELHFLEADALFSRTDVSQRTLVWLRVV